MRAETGHHKMENYACFLWDLSRQVNPDLLWARAERRNFPLEYFRSGLAAGCGFATTWVRVYSMDPLEAWQKANPKAQLSVFIDDLLGDTSGSQEHTRSQDGSLQLQRC